MPDCRTEYLVTRNKQFFCMTIFFLFLSLSVKSQTVSVADFLGDRQAAVSEFLRKNAAKNEKGY